jgi:hypothetical protein
MKIQTFLWQECQDFCEALAGDPELARQEIQKRITKLILTPMETPDGAVLEVSEDVGLFRGAGVMLQSSLEGIAQHYTGFRTPHRSCHFITSRYLTTDRCGATD